MAETNATGAEQVRWNLADLHPNHAALDADLEGAERDAENFAEMYRGRVAALDAPTFSTAMKTLDGLHDRVGRAFTYAYLNWSTATEDARRGALLQHVREAYTRIGQHLIFFEVEWAGLDEATAKTLLASDDLAPFRHYLELKYEAREHVLTEPEEKIMADCA